MQHASLRQVSNCRIKKRDSNRNFLPQMCACRLQNLFGKTIVERRTKALDARSDEVMSIGRCLPSPWQRTKRPAVNTVQSVEAQQKPVANGTRKNIEQILGGRKSTKETAPRMENKVAGNVQDLLRAIESLRAETDCRALNPSAVPVCVYVSTRAKLVCDDTEVLYKHLSLSIPTA